MPRKMFDGEKLIADVARLGVIDRQSPPQARPSLMDAVREFAGFIDARTRLGWTDAMIAALLTAAGYEINAATLRSYRKRLRDEGLITANQPLRRDARASSPPSVSPLPAAAPTPVVTAEAPARGMSADEPPAAGPAPVGSPRPPPSPPAGRRSFAVDRSSLPPDRA
ncbi:hypothetical protein [Sphingomonas sp.]|uniref:hypothetical protein n=1 Tax=Sphingomonas sp. TaxID=28214 RepID=UPI003AFF66DF